MLYIVMAQAATGALAVLTPVGSTQSHAMDMSTLVNAGATLLAALLGFLLGLCSQRYFARSERKRQIAERRWGEMVAWVDDFVASAYAAKALFDQRGELLQKIQRIKGSRKNDSSDPELISMKEQLELVTKEAFALAAKFLGADALRNEWKGRLRYLGSDSRVDTVLNELWSLLIDPNFTALSKADLDKATKLANEIRVRVEVLISKA
ncbi:MAG: hypothetical protein HY533_02620 [Chloroflexi bacterium]|nr:hypothetical protein [Chloroflexota bacterium]